MQTHSLMHAAALLGVHKSTLQNWLAQGCPAVERGDRERGQNWKISLKDVVDWRIERAVADAVAAYGGDGAEMSREEADRRRAVAIAHIAEIDLDERLSNTISRSEAVAIFAGFCQSLRSGVGSVFDKIAHRAATMTNPHEIRCLGEEEWNRAMELARSEFHRTWDESFGAGKPLTPPADE